MRRFLFFLAVFLVACGEQRLEPVRESGALVVLIRPGLTTYTAEDADAEKTGAGERPSGFDYDLVALFAEELGLKLRLKVVASDADIDRGLRAGQAHLGAAWLTAENHPDLAGGKAYQQAGDVLVTHEASLPVHDPQWFNGKRVHVLAGSRQAMALRKMQEKYPQLEIHEEAVPDETALLEGVEKRRFEAALVDQASFDIASNFFPELQASLEVGEKLPVRWFFPPDVDAGFMQRAEQFIERVQADGTLARLRDRYFGHVERLNPADIVRFIERSRTVLPRYRAFFQSAQVSSGIDWRLLAALAYQESQWNPLATSPTNVRGMMMLTEETADHLGVRNRLDAGESIHAGARYLGDLRAALPDSVNEPDRTWLALAAYNLGMGHLNGARSIARSLKSDPDSWYEMKRVLPLLMQRQYYGRLKSGRARGGEAVILVENIRVFTDILNRHEAAFRTQATAHLSR